jgi:hypothetical protein
MGKNRSSRWKITNNGVHVLDRVGYRISYNPSTLHTFRWYKSKHTEFQFEKFTDSKETALYIAKKDCYLVLDGDFRKEFEACANLMECLLMYKQLAQKYRSKWSMDRK